MRFAVALLAAASALAQTYTLRTFAGGALPDRLPGTSASLGAVAGVAVDTAGNVYLSLTDYHLILRLDANGILTRLAGDGCASAAALSSPAGLAISPEGALYIADSANFRVRMLSGGSLSTVAGNGTQGYGGDGDSALTARFDAPSAVAFDSAGNLYVADFFNHVVRKVAAGRVTTIAGDGTYGLGAENVPATSTPLAGPSGLALDSAGNLYIAELYNNRVRKVSNGVITTVAGNGIAGFSGDKSSAISASLRQPSDVVIDPAGNLYIADYGNNRIRMVAPNGIITTFAGSTGLSGPRRIALDSSGNLYIADADRVVKVSKGAIAIIAGGGTPVGENGPATSAQLLSPLGLAVDSAGALYVSDPPTGRILKIAGGVLTRIPTNVALSAPAGLAIDSAGALYAANTPAAMIIKIANGTVRTDTAAGKLTAPEALAVDSAGTLYISDVNRVRAVAGSAVTTFAGNGSVGYQGDGALATAARLSSPVGLAIDSTGNLVIADSGNNRLRTVSAGIISTIAGTGAYGATGGNGIAATSAALCAPTAVASDPTGDLYFTDCYRVLKLSKGKLYTIAGLSNPQGIALDSTGNIYVADPANHRIAVLAPAASSCAVTVNPTAPRYPAAGGAFTLSLQTGDSCAWAVDSLPPWLNVSALYGTGPATLTVTLDPNQDEPRTATLAIGSQSLAVTQAGAALISGVVATSAAKFLPGVSIALSGSATATAITDAGGNFAFPNLDSTGTYTITPTLAGYNFVPASQTFTTLTATPIANFTAWPQPRIAALAPTFAGSLQPSPAAFAAGEIVTLYGANFCADPPAAANPALPDRLAACMVRVDNTAVRLYYASATQINAVLPQTLTAGAHTLIVQRYTTTSYSQLAAQSAALTVTIERTALAFLERTENGAPLLAVQFSDGGFAGASRPVRAGDAVVLYLTGLGRKQQTFTEGTAPGKTSASIETVQISAAGLPATLLYSGVQPQFPGLDQITLQLPKFTSQAGAIALQITSPVTGQTLRYSLPAF